MSPALATASRSSREGCEFLWNRVSSMVSWTLVKRLRVRREALMALGVMSSDDEKLAAEDVRDSEETASMAAEGDNGGSGAN